MFFTRFLCMSHLCIFHEKIITFLFVTLWDMIEFSSNFCRRRKTQLPYWIYTLKRPMSPFPRFFFLKTWNFHCTRTSKNWKIHDFFWLFSFVLILFSNSKIVRRTRFCVFYSDPMPKTHSFWWFTIKKQFFQLFYEKICTLLFVTLSHMIGLSSIFLQKKWNTFTLSNIYILMHNNTFSEFFFENMKFSLYPEV